MRSAIPAVIFGVLGVIGCAQQAPPKMTPCGTTSCDATEVCDLTDPAGPTCIDADGDLDGDGIPNSMDLCDHVPGGLYDEDRDGIGDECDKCPIAPPPSTPDPDGDDVDSPCDPDPLTPGDKIVAFSGFHDLPATWTALTPTAWQIEGGQLVVTPPDPNTDETLTVPLISSNDIAIISEWRIDAANAAADKQTTGVAAIDRRPAGVAQVNCSAVQDFVGQRLLFVTDSANASQPMTELFGTAGLYDLEVEVTGPMSACALVADSGQGVAQAAVSPDTMTEVDLVVHGATARFSYLLVIARTATTTP